MDKLAERIGLYDLWVTFFPGATLLTQGLLFVGAFHGIQNDKFTYSSVIRYLPSSLFEFLFFILLSVFIGIVLQEVARMIRIKVGLKDASECLLKHNHGIFTETEIGDFRKKYTELWPEKGMESADESKHLFHRINAVAQEKGIAARYAKLNAIQQKSLSLSLVTIFGCIMCLILLVLSIIKYCVLGITLASLGMVLSALLTILLLKRSERFNRNWVRCIVYAVAAYMEAQR